MNNQNWPFTEPVDPNIYNVRTHWPKISIVTPSYNQGQFIEETILSVLNQNYPNLEYIIIDGGSTDNTVEIIKKYEDRVTYWISEKDNGQTHAINKGLEKASGEIFAYLNSDDCYYPEALAEIAKIFIAEQGDILLYGNSKNGPSFDNITHQIIPDFKIENIYLGYGLFPQPSVFWTSSNLIFEESLVFSMDHDYWIKLFENGYKFRYINRELSFYREHKDAKGEKLLLTFWTEELIISLNILKNKKHSHAHETLLDDLHFKFLQYYRVFLLNSGNKKELVKRWFHIVRNNPLTALKTLRYFVSILRRN